MLVIFASIFISIILYWVINPDISFWEATKKILIFVFFIFLMGIADY